MSIVLYSQNISKQYRLGTVGTGTLSHDLNRWWHKVRGKEDPYLKIGAVNDRSSKGESDYVWALKDINFEVEQGEVLGIIGKNGAGKSTLLKILSRVTSPSTGSIKTKGRIASLLEVGTGFHPELTGRENIYLNGAILGMSKPEIQSKLEEIIAFSGCQRYIDTPVKRYSSGMTVRLAFAVAAHLEPEILVVDEVLAVGDAEFQKKAIGKMQDISRGEGRTVLFVSHNMAAIKNLCTRVMVLENGSTVFSGDTSKAISIYLGKVDSTEIRKNLFKKTSSVHISSIVINEDYLSETILTGSNLTISVGISVAIQPNMDLHLGVYNEREEKLLHLSNLYDKSFKNNETQKGKKFICKLENIPLNTGYYYVNVALSQNGNIIDHQVKALLFYVTAIDFYDTGKTPSENESLFLIKQNWKMM